MRAAMAEEAAAVMGVAAMVDVAGDGVVEGHGVEMAAHPRGPTQRRLPRHQIQSRSRQIRRRPIQSHCRR